jgi:hypothetical protein
MSRHGPPHTGSLAVGPAAALPVDRSGGDGTSLPPLAAANLWIDSAMMFDGAALELCGCRILIVYVSPAVMGAVYESQLLVAAFQVRYRRTITLVTLGEGSVPTYFGPEDVARVLARIPFDALPWRRYRYKKPAPMLPIPIDPPDPLTRSLSPDDRESVRAPRELLTRPERPRAPRDPSDRDVPRGR